LGIEEPNCVSSIGFWADFVRLRKGGHKSLKFLFAVFSITSEFQNPEWLGALPILKT
jgi:hypothetical protein